VLIVFSDGIGFLTFQCLTKMYKMLSSIECIGFEHQKGMIGGTEKQFQKITGKPLEMLCQNPQ